MRRTPFDDGLTRAVRHLVGTGLVVTVLLVLVGGLMLAVAVATQLANGADVF